MVTQSVKGALLVAPPTLKVLTASRTFPVGAWRGTQGSVSWGLALSVGTAPSSSGTRRRRKAAHRERPRNQDCCVLVWAFSMCCNVLGSVWALAGLPGSNLAFS